jgi:hypothetical protein
MSTANRTTTTVPLWQVDCENFRRTGKPFELRDVATTIEHRMFIEEFSARYELTVRHGDGFAVFESPNKRKNTTQIIQDTPSGRK